MQVLKAHFMVKENILECIGSTPMVRINRLCPNPDVRIFAKLEGFNPTGSIKDRIAVKMIETAEREGRLRPGHTIIEPTSGNTGIGLAIVGIVKGYPVEIVMSSAVSVERRKIIRSLRIQPPVPSSLQGIGKGKDQFLLLGKRRKPPIQKLLHGFPVRALPEHRDTGYLECVSVRNIRIIQVSLSP